MRRKRNDNRTIYLYRDGNTYVFNLVAFMNKLMRY